MKIAGITSDVKEFGHLLRSQGNCVVKNGNASSASMIALSDDAGYGASGDVLSRNDDGASAAGSDPAGVSESWQSAPDTPAWLGRIHHPVMGSASKFSLPSAILLGHARAPNRRNQRKMLERVSATK